MPGIYKINFVGDETNYTYIGKTINDFEYRWKEHRSALLKGKHHNDRMQHVWNKYQNLEFSILEETSCPVEQARLEHLHIKSIWKQRHCLNLILPPLDDVRGAWSEESKRKLSKTKTGKPHSQAHRDAISKGKTGTTRPKFTEEHKQNISRSIRATLSKKVWPKKPPEPCSFLGKDYEDIQDAADEWKCSVETMKGWLKGHGKLPFEYKGVYYRTVRAAMEATGDSRHTVDKYLAYTGARRGRISTYDKKQPVFSINGKKFTFIREAAEHYDVSRQTIKDWIKIFKSDDVDFQIL